MAGKLTRDGNFVFADAFDHQFYLKAREAEQTARTDCHASGSAIRNAYERLITLIIRDCGLENYISIEERARKRNNRMRDVSELKARVDCLRSTANMIAAGVVKDEADMRQNGPLPILGRTTCYIRKGAMTDYMESSESTYDMVRWLGNTCSHDDLKSTQVRPEYASVIAAIKALYDIAVWHWRNQRENIPAFDESIMPIENYHITSGYVPADTEQSHCLMEFTGFLEDNEGQPSYYAILRMYAWPRNKDRNFVLRNLNIYKVANADRPYDVPGMKRPIEVTPLNAQSHGYYILAYQFKKEPQPLTSELLHSITEPAARLAIGLQLVHCMNELHLAESPISHRMLNYTCVYVCAYRNQVWAPDIIKFDYAKISQAENPVRTVFMNARDARQSIRQMQRLNKYIAPEWDQLDKNADDASWSRVDVYSLGILLIEILLGRIMDSMPGEDALYDLEDLGFPAELIDTLELMCAADPNARPDLRTVSRVLESARATVSGR